MEERLQKYLANSGVASRRKCEELILQGKVEVNGKIVTELGTKVNPEKDSIKFDGKARGLKEGHKLGREEGKKIGREEGKKIGREEGEKIGAKKAKIDIVTKLLERNLSISEISEISGISIDEIEQIKKQI